MEGFSTDEPFNGKNIISEELEKHHDILIREEGISKNPSSRLRSVPEDTPQRYKSKGFSIYIYICDMPCGAIYCCRNEIFGICIISQRSKAELYRVGG